MATATRAYGAAASDGLVGPKTRADFFLFRALLKELGSTTGCSNAAAAVLMYAAVYKSTIHEPLRVLRL